MFRSAPLALSLAVLLSIGLTACADDGETAADKAGIGAECAAAADCEEAGQSCLTQFKGGYCGVADCTADAACPSGSRCVTHTDGTNYCFRECIDKVDCNRHRTVANEANCVGSITFVDAAHKGKACEPPSGN
jgi:hypothetical protein